MTKAKMRKTRWGDVTQTVSPVQVIIAYRTNTTSILAVATFCMRIPAASSRCACFDV